MGPQEALIISHAACLRHDPGAGHAEAPARLEAVLEELGTPPFSDWPRRSAPRAATESLLGAHSEAYLQHIFATTPKDGRVMLDPDTFMGPDSLEGALRAAGAVVEAVDALAEHDRVFCAVRPPGHHAERERAMGFCIFNGISVGAAHALRCGYERVAIVDFDVHHGNGTEAIFEQEPRTLYLSSHESPLYPGTGLQDTPRARNRPLPAGAGSAAFRAAWEDLLGELDAYRPSLILISAGFDAHRLDPLGHLEVDDQDYAWLTQGLVELANAHCQGKLVSVLEGGYSLEALKSATRAHLQALAG